MNNIFIVTHKKIDNKDILPSSYKNILVGKQKNNNFDFSDSTGDNISEKNPYYCELTALYWIWKNYSFDDCDCLGICHYRRFFWLNNIEKSYVEKAVDDIKKYVNYLDVSMMDEYFKKYDIIVPEARYYKTSITKHYCDCNRKSDYDVLKEVIFEKYPSYMDDFTHVFSGNKLHICNMFITSGKVFRDYCRWLFDVLFEVEKRVNIPYDDEYQKRIFGFLSERLLNVYIYHHKLKAKEVPIIFISKENEDLKKDYKYYIKKYIYGLKINEL